MIYELSCGCEREIPGVHRTTKAGNSIYCPQHGFVTITAITRPPRAPRVAFTAKGPPREKKPRSPRSPRKPQKKKDNGGADIIRPGG